LIQRAPRSNQDFKTHPVESARLLLLLDDRRKPMWTSLTRKTSLKSEDVDHTDKVEVQAILTSTGRQNSFLEQIVSRLSLERQRLARRSWPNMIDERRKALDMHLSNDDKPGPRCEMPFVVRKQWSLPIRK
jgi:hypothetical protein